MGRDTKQARRRVSEGERHIGLRLAYLRRWHKMTQSAVAARLGLTRAQLSTIESGRVALRFQTGWNVCKLFDIHPSWLDTGHWPVDEERPFPPLDHPWMDRVERMIAANKNTLFSQGWPEVGWLLGPDAPALAPSGQIIAARLADSDDSIRKAAALPARARTVAAFERENASREAPEIGEKKVLTAISSSANLASVKSPLAQLLERLNRATAAKGRKAELADYLKAPRPCVSDWLSGKREPCGETTLKLLHWVEQQEAQQKQNPVAALTATGHKTQPSKSSYEKTKSNPEKR
jgi:transcriptional regulator with XRE-family HTH domain